jgi:hypothetical protein
MALTNPETFEHTIFLRKDLSAEECMAHFNATAEHLAANVMGWDKHRLVGVERIGDFSSSCYLYRMVVERVSVFEPWAGPDEVSKHEGGRRYEPEPQETNFDVRSEPGQRVINVG